MVDAQGRRTGGRPNRDRRVVSMYVARSGIDRVTALAAEEGITRTAMFRRLLALGLETWESRPKPQRT